MDGNMAALNAGRDLTRTWIVVDMDAFFASVEERDNPILVNLMPFWDSVDIHA
jgi:DNA polymerase kappa